MNSSTQPSPAESLSGWPQDNPTIPSQLPLPTRTWSDRATQLVKRLVIILAGVGGIVSLAFYAPSSLGLVAGKTDRPLSVAVRKGTLRIVVTERGNMESMKTVDGVCEVQGGQIKIIQLLPEGSRVKTGDIVCRFDSSEIEKNIATQQIKVKQALGKSETSKQEIEIVKNKGQIDVTKATVELTLAEIDLEKYKEGDFLVEINDIQGQIALARKTLEDSTSVRDQTRELVKKGFRSPEQLRSQEQTTAQADFNLKRDMQKLEVKKKYEYLRKTTEFSSKVSQSQGEKRGAEATAKAQVSKATSQYDSDTSTEELEKRQLNEFLKQKDKTIITAAQAGVVAYANEPYFDSSRQIREGAMVYNRQRIFTLPDMSRMQVKVNIHESLIKKVKTGQMAEIRIDAFPSMTLIGKVVSVSQLADSNRMWGNGGAKEYTTVVTIEKMPDEELKPGMTAEVRIMIATLAEVLLVPVQAVSEVRGEHYAYVDHGSKIERKKVKVGETNEKHVQILDGLKEGDLVLLDARTRSLAELKDSGKESEPESPPVEKASPDPAPAPPIATNP